MRSFQGDLADDKPFPMSRKDCVGFIGKPARNDGLYDLYQAEARERVTNCDGKPPSNQFFLVLLSSEMAMTMRLP